MQVESLISVSFTPEELKEALMMLMECELNDTVYGTDEHTRRKQILDHARSNVDADMAWVDGRFVLCIDGVAAVEPF